MEEASSVSSKKPQDHTLHSIRLPSDFTSPRIRSQEIAARIITNALDVIEIINVQERKNFKLGVLLLVVAISTWLVGLELVNVVLKGDEFRKPFFLAFLTGSCFMLNFLPEVGQIVVSLGRRTESHDVSGDLSPMLSSADLEPPTEPLELELNSSKAVEKLMDGSDSPIPLSRKEILVLALQIAIIYFFYNTFVMLALQYTSASNQTVLGSTTAVFTLFLGVYLNIDKFTSKKLICVAASLTGVCLINLSDKGSSEDDGNKFKPKNPTFGNLLALLGAFFYALYLVVMKVKCGTGNKTTNERILFGWVGVFTFILGVPVLLAVHVTGIEEFKAPPNATVFTMILINSVFSVISDYVTILAMLLTSPLVTSLSLTSSIPLTIFIDFLTLYFTGSDAGSTTNLYVYSFGVLTILMSVILVNINITTENDLIEEVIEETLEGAIRHDEVLSPVFSPYLGSSTGYAQSPRENGVGISELSPNFPFFKRKNGKYTSSPWAPTPLTRDLTGFNLNNPEGNPSEVTPFQNSNHHRSLYTIDSGLLDDLSPETTTTTLHVSGGVNHSYHVKHVDQTPSTKFFNT